MTPPNSFTDFLRQAVFSARKHGIEWDERFLPT